MESRERVSVDITSSTIFRVVLILLGVWFVYLVLDILLMLFAAIVIASAIEPIANYFQRFRIPRPLSVVLVYILLILVLSSVVALLIQPLGEQVQQLAQALPQAVTAASRYVPLVGGVDEVALGASLQEVVARVGQNVASVSLNILHQTRNFFSGIFTLLFVFILAFYLVVERDALKKFARIVTPHEHLLYVERSLDRAQRNIGRWVLAQLTLAVIIGVLVGLGLWVIGVPYALVLGLLAGILEIIPVIGPIVAAIPGVIVALSQSLTLGVIALVFYVLVQQAENHFLVPTVMRRAIGLNPLVTLIAILLGARLAGTIGVILSVPIATVLSIFLADIFSTETLDEGPPG